MTKLIDPKKEALLIPLSELEGVLLTWQINTQASGQAPISAEAERWLVERLRILDSPETVNLPRKVHVNGPTKGPIPSEWTGMATHEVTSSAVTYALRFGDRSLWKIGHAQGLENRLDDINKHIPIEVLDEWWEFAFVQRWQNSISAYEMEQKVLELLTKHRTVGERVICSRGELEAVWTSAAAFVIAKQRANPTVAGRP